MKFVSFHTLNMMTASLPSFETNNIMSRGSIPRKSAFSGPSTSRTPYSAVGFPRPAYVGKTQVPQYGQAATPPDAPSDLHVPDFSTDYDSEVARLMPSSSSKDTKDTNVNSSDTEDASEGGENRDGDTAYGDEAPGPSGLGSGHAIKEQVYLDKLEQLKSDLTELEEGRHPQFLAEFEKIDRLHAEWNRATEVDFTYNIQVITNDFLSEQRAALREFEEKKSELKEGLLMNLMKQKELIESERYGHELSLDTPDMKPASTRKLRRRPNDPVPVPEKNRRKTPQSQVTFLLEDTDVLHDLSVIKSGEGGSGSPSKKSRQQQQRHSPPRQSSHSGSKSPSPIPNSDTRIEDGKLFYEKRWFHRGQPIYLEGKEMLRVIGVIGGISQDTVWVRKVGDNSSKLRVPLLHLMKGKLVIKRRA